MIVIARKLCCLHTAKLRLWTRGEMQTKAVYDSRYQYQKAHFPGHNLPQVTHCHLHVQGQYQERQGKVRRSGSKA